MKDTLGPLGQVKLLDRAQARQGAFEMFEASLAGGDRLAYVF